MTDGIFDTTDLKKEIKDLEMRTKIKEVRLGEKTLGFQPEFPITFIEDMENKRVIKSRIEESQRLKKDVERVIDEMLKEQKEYADRTHDTGEFEITDGEMANIILQKCMLTLEELKTRLGI